jgi:signal transduction histidine kinase
MSVLGGERIWCPTLAAVATAAARRVDARDVLVNSLKALRDGFDLPLAEAYWITPHGVAIAAAFGKATDNALDTAALAAECAHRPFSVRRGGTVAAPVVTNGEVRAVLILELGPGRQENEEHFLALVAHLVAIGIDQAEMLGTLAEREAQRTRLLRQLLFAHEEERRRLGRELHDEIGSLLTGALLALQADGGAGARDAILTAMGEVRRMSRELRPAMLEELGLEKAIERYTEEFAKRTGLAVSADVLLPRLEQSHEIALFRIVQEALTNVARHARAHKVRIEVSGDNQVIEGLIEDDGRGFHPEFTHDTVGLVGMRERAEQLGGHLTVESVPGSGTRLSFRVPV